MNETNWPDEDLDGCPMCGHLFVSDDGRCANCGEQLLTSTSPGLQERRTLFNWRFGLGSFLLVAFTMLTIAQMLHVPELPQRERTFHKLVALALGCAAVIGFILLIRGILQAIPRSAQDD